MKRHLFLARGLGLCGKVVTLYGQTMNRRQVTCARCKRIYEAGPEARIAALEA